MRKRISCQITADQVDPNSKNSSVESENWYINVCNIFLFSLQLNCCLRITLIIKPIGRKNCLAYHFFSYRRKDTGYTYLFCEGEI